LLTDGQAVVRVPPKMMAEQRRIARTRGKSHPIDAAAVARAALREPDLPVASHDDTSRELKLLVDRREDLVTMRTATINRLLWSTSSNPPGRRPRSRWT
jgi:transposase